MRMYNRQWKAIEQILHMMFKTFWLYRFPNRKHDRIPVSILLEKRIAKVYNQIRYLKGNT